MKQIYFLAVAATLALMSCEKNDDNTVVSQAVKISASIGESISSRASDASWTEGDSIGVTSTFKEVTGPFINIKYTNTGGNRFTGNPLYFYNPMTFTAYYPFTGEEGNVPGDNGIISASTNAENQTSANQPLIDFLHAGQTEIVIKDNKPEISFTFEHKMSKLTLTFINGNGADVSKIVSYQIDGLVLDGTFDTATGDCAAGTDTEAQSLNIALPEGTVKSEVALPSLIIFPQACDNVKLTITDSDGQYYECALAFKDSNLASGNNYHFTVTVNKTGLNVNTEDITDWVTNGSSTNASSVVNPDKQA